MGRFLAGAFVVFYVVARGVRHRRAFCRGGRTPDRAVKVPVRRRLTSSPRMGASTNWLTRVSETLLIAISVELISIYLLHVRYKPGSHLVIWDDHCSFCRSWAKWFRRLDWLGMLRFEGSSNREVLAAAGITAEEADREIKLVIDGRVYGGFDAVRRVLAVLPVSLTWEPILRLKPIRLLGHRVYREVAVRRNCLLPPP